MTRHTRLITDRVRQAGAATPSADYPQGQIIAGPRFPSADRPITRPDQSPTIDLAADHNGGYLRAGVDQHESLSVTQRRGLAVGILCLAG